MTDRSDEWHPEETYKSMMQYGQGMLKYTFLTNGAAIIAILSFLGNLYARDISFPNMKVPLLLFVAGIIASGLASITSYLTQFWLLREATDDADPKGMKSYRPWLYSTFILVILSLSLFSVGALCAVYQLK